MISSLVFQHMLLWLSTTSAFTLKTFSSTFICCHRFSRHFRFQLFSRATKITFQLLLVPDVPLTPPCSSRSSQTSTRAPWGRRLSVGSGCWLPGRQWAGNGSDLQTRSAWSPPLPFCLWSTAQGSLERQRSRLKIGDHKEKLNLQCYNSPCPYACVLTADKTKETYAHNGKRAAYFNPPPKFPWRAQQWRILYWMSML